MQKTVGFVFIFLLLEPIALGKKKKRLLKEKRQEAKQHNKDVVRSFFFFFFLFPPEIHPLRRGGESSVPQDTT